MELDDKIIKELCSSNKHKSKAPNWIKKLLGYCELHGWFKYPRRYRQFTDYVNEEDNFSYGCKKCIEESDNYWTGMWIDTYHRLPLEIVYKAYLQRSFKEKILKFLTNKLK